MKNLFLLITALFFVSVSHAVESPKISGEWVQGGLLQGVVSPSDSVQFMGRDVRVDEEGLFVFGLGRNAPEKVELTIVDEHGNTTKQQFSVRQRSYDEQIVNGVPQRTVTPAKAALERIRKEAALVSKARQGHDERKDFLPGFRMPLQGPISGVYGSRRVYNGTPGRPHYGLDIAAPTGTLVYAPAGGVVKLAYDDMYYSGGTLILDHGHGVSSTFIHLSAILVREGEVVESGDPIAKVGASGRATGPHLDWRINWFDVRIDPALVLKHFPHQKAP